MKDYASYFKMAGQALELLYSFAVNFSAHNISSQTAVDIKQAQWKIYETERTALTDMAYIGAQHSHSVNITLCSGYNKIAHLVDNCVSAQLLYAMTPANGGCVWSRRLDDIVRYEAELKELLVAYYREKDKQEAGSAADALRDAAQGAEYDGLPF